MIKIELTQEQFNTVLQLIDIAIKAGGYANAKVAVPIVESLLNQAENPKPEQQFEMAK
jgi:hypothetical protein